MNIACVLVNNFPLKMEYSQRSVLEKHNVILYKKTGSQRTVVDISPGIDHVVIGMPLQDARFKCKNAVFVEADMPKYEQAFTSILARLGDCSPVVESDSLGCAYIGLNGIEQIYGSEAKLINILMQTVPRYLKPRLGIGTGKFPAYLAATSAGPNKSYKIHVELTDFLGPFSVDTLPVSWSIKTRLHSFGLHTLRHIANLPIGPIQAQFGSTGTKMWHLANGIDETPLIPRQPEEKIIDKINFDVATISLKTLLIAIEILLKRLFRKPEMQGRLSRTALIEGHVMNGPTWKHRIMFKIPEGNNLRAYSIIESSLRDLTLPGPLENISLMLTNLTGEIGQQQNLFHKMRRMSQMREAVSQIKASQGENPLYRIRQVEPWSRIPERQTALIPFEP